VLLTPDAQDLVVECQLARQGARLIAFVIDVVFYALVSAAKMAFQSAGFDAIGTLASGFLTLAGVVIVDTTVWIDYFQGTSNRETDGSKPNSTGSGSG
jgi:hypothetical protein